MTEGRLDDDGAGLGAGDVVGSNDGVGGTIALSESVSCHVTSTGIFVQISLTFLSCRGDWCHPHSLPKVSPSFDLAFCGIFEMLVD